MPGQLIPYKSSNEMILSVMQGQTLFAISDGPPAIPQIKAGKVRALAVTSAKRSAATPDVPTVAEATGFSAYEASTWQGLVFPAATGRALVQRVSDECRHVLGMPDVRDRLRDLGYEPVGSTPAEFVAKLRADHAAWSRVARDAHIKAD